MMRNIWRLLDRKNFQRQFLGWIKYYFDFASLSGYISNPSNNVNSQATGA